jgi:hypothetical protein
MSSNLFSYPSGATTAANVDLTGFDVAATDGHIGKIDEATYETSASYVVVDTGFWTFGKKRLIPAGVVGSIDSSNETVHVRMTKDQVKKAPDYDSNRNQRGADQDQYRNELGSYYSPYSSE